MDEKRLLAACLSGDEKAWETFFRRYASRVCGAAASRLRRGPRAVSQQDIDNVCQQVFLRLIENGYRRLRMFDPERGRLETWLAAIAIRAAASYLAPDRAAASTVPLREDDAAGAAGSATLPARLGEEGPDSAQSRRELASALAKLSPRERLAVKLAYYDGLTHREVARALGMPVGSVSALLREAFEGLRALLGEIFPGFPY